VLSENIGDCIANLAYSTALELGKGTSGGRLVRSSMARNALMDTPEASLQVGVPKTSN
jgi:hypothetical protein